MRGESIVGILFLFRLSFDVTLCIFGIGQTVCFLFLCIFSYLYMPFKGGLRGRVNVGESWGTGWRVRVLAGGRGRLDTARVQVLHMLIVMVWCAFLPF